MLRRVGVAGLVMGACLMIAGPAVAHVTISPPTAVKGSDAVLSFNVANESDTATTTQVLLSFPPDHPIAVALVEPIAGWTAKVDTVKVDNPIQTDEGPVTEAVSQVTWSGGKIEAGQFQAFSVSVGLPADTDSLVFKVLQTYSDGTIVRWIEEAPPGGAEPEHPAPVLTLTAAEGDNGTTATTAPSTPAAAKDLAKKDDVNGAKTLGLVGVIAGALGLVAGVGALAMKRRP